MGVILNYKLASILKNKYSRRSFPTTQTIICSIKCKSLANRCFRTYHLVIFTEKAPILLPARKKKKIILCYAIKMRHVGQSLVLSYHSCAPLLSFNTRSFHIRSCLTESVRSGSGSIVTGSLLLRRFLSPLGSLVLGLAPFLRSGNR